MPTPLRVLILEDQPADAELMLEELRQGGFDPEWQRVDTEAGYLGGLDSSPSVILADFRLPQFDAPRALEILMESGLDIPFIVVSGAIGEETAVAIMRQGAADYLLKDRMGRLAPAVTSALEKKRLREENLASEELARRAELRYREIFENAMEGIYQSTPQGQILTANPAMAAMLGLASPEEVMATVQDAVGSLHVDPGRHAELVHLLGESGAVRGFECHFYRQDRTTICVAMNSRAVFDTRGKAVLYSSTVQDVTGLKAAEAALQRYQKELRDLAARLIAGQESENKRLGRELHDGFSQKLAALGMDVGMLRAKPPDSPRILQERLEGVLEQIKQLAKSIHQSSRTLHPAVLYDLGLSEALRLECEAFAEQTGIQVNATIIDPPEWIPDDISLCLYRITQESLWNTRKHAKASEVTVVLRAGAGEFVLTIGDNGCGFARDAVRGQGGLGLVSMEERVRLVNGELSVVSGAGGGTRVEARVPAKS